MKRITKLEQLMKHAEVAAMRSHDSETQVGCVLVDEVKMTPKLSACNGFISGAPDHKLPSIRPHKYSYMVHSEINLIAAVAASSESTKDCFLVCTHSPCVTCMRAVYQAGIRRVVIKTKYTDFDELKQMLDLSITEITTEEGFTELTYAPRQD